MNDVTPPEARLNKVIEGEDDVTRAKTRERVARHRAAKKQAASIEFVRTDASLFLHPDRLSQKAGAPKAHLRRMAIKELVDNALDAAADVKLTEVDADTFIVEDSGPGISPQKAMALFSVTRPMMSTKLIRRPLRGAVGNGLRVVTGAAFASGGTITVESRGVSQKLTFDRSTGETTAAARADSDVKLGTRITIIFGAALPRDTAASSWGSLAIRLGGKSAEPMLTHPNWYGEAAFSEVINSARGTAGELAALFGVDLGNADGRSKDLAQSDGAQRYTDPEGLANSLTLTTLQALAPKPPKLIPIADDAFPGAHKVEKFEATVAGGTVPAIVQVWAKQIGERPGAIVSLVINRTPTVADLSIYPGRDALLRGCGLLENVGTVPKGSYRIVVAITTPAVALISDGKTPDLSPFVDGIETALVAAIRRAHKPKSRGVSIKDAAFEVMEEAYMLASAGNTLPANARQIMYAARPFILRETGNKDLNDAYFTQALLPAFIAENPNITAEWDVVYDARGHFVEPHSRRSIPLGTLQVRSYLSIEREEPGALVAIATGLHRTVGPGDRYGAVLFIEKEGFEPLLRAAKIAERFDIAIMSTKGMSVIAARTMIDRISSDGLKILVAHDLDATGMGIFGTLGADSDRYTFKAPPNVHRLGLRLGQAEDMNLATEPQTVEGDQDKLNERLKRYGADREEREFILSGRRVELNAMPSDVFLEWLERGLRGHGVAKVIPPADIMETFARRVMGLRFVEDRANELEKVARAHAAAADLPPALAEQLAAEFQRDDAISWETAVERAISRNGDLAHG